MEYQSPGVFWKSVLYITMRRRPRSERVYPDASLTGKNARRSFSKKQVRFRKRKEKKRNSAGENADKFVLILAFVRILGLSQKGLPCPCPLFEYQHTPAVKQYIPIKAWQHPADIYHSFFTCRKFYEI
jgi:hypothetical protein